MHWKARLRETCATIFRDMQRRYNFTYIPTRNNKNAHATIGDAGKYEIRCQFPIGYTGLAVFLHEVAHTVNRDCHPSSKSDLMQETAAWGFAKNIFTEYSLTWVPSVSNLARNCLTSHINATDEKIEPGGTPAAIIAALTKLDKVGI